MQARQIRHLSYRTMVKRVFKRCPPEEKSSGEGASMGEKKLNVERELEAGRASHETVVAPAPVYKAEEGRLPAYEGQRSHVAPRGTSSMYSEQYFRGGSLEEMRYEAGGMGVAR